MKYFISISLIALILFTNAFMIAAEPQKPEENKEKQYRTLDEAKEELREQRKIEEKQRMEALKEKQLEREQKKAEEKKENFEDENHDNKDGVPNKEKSDNIPKLIVRLRGSHSTKYLCSYDFIEKDENTETSLTKEIITDYNKLLKKPSLKVRPGEIINFEFSEKPSKMDVFIWGEEMKSLSVKRGTIKVPNIDGKIVVGIDGKYKNGSIRYAIVLDIRA